MGTCTSAEERRLRATSLATPKLEFDGHICKAKCVKVYDGDTIHVVIEYPRREYHRFVARMAGYNSAELRGGTPEETDAGLRAKSVLEGLILDKIITIHCGKYDKYGRLLITVYYSGTNVNEWMVSHNYGQPYTGSGEKRW